MHVLLSAIDFYSTCWSFYRTAHATPTASISLKTLKPRPTESGEITRGFFKEQDLQTLIPPIRMKFIWIFSMAGRPP